MLVTLICFPWKIECKMKLEQVETSFITKASLMRRERSKQHQTFDFDYFSSFSLMSLSHMHNTKHTAICLATLTLPLNAHRHQIVLCTQRDRQIDE